MSQARESAPAPVFSILIGRVSTEDGARVLEALDALRRQDGAFTYEVIIVDRLHDAVSARIRSAYPEAKLRFCASALSLPEMRAAALGEARGRYIIVTEDHCVPVPSWLRTFYEGFTRHPDAAAIAGCVENGVTDTALDWATYLCEYAGYAPPVAEGDNENLAGMNIAYRREALDSVPQGSLTKGFWETTVHPILSAQGKKLVSTNAIRIQHCKKFSFGLFASQRLAYSRYFAGIRFGPDQHLRRWFAAAASPALPALLVWRLARAMRDKPAIAGPALRALPFLLAFFVVWAVGEAIGYVAGPGAALREIE